MIDPMRPEIALALIEGTFSTCRLPAKSPISPAFIDETGEALISITRTRDELSVICPDSMLRPGVLPADAVIEPGWRALGVLGPLDFSLIGIMAGLTASLAAVKVSILAISTYDTDYVLVKEGALETALTALRESGYTIR